MISYGFCSLQIADCQEFDGVLSEISNLESTCSYLHTLYRLRSEKYTFLSKFLDSMPSDVAGIR